MRYSSRSPTSTSDSVFVPGAAAPVHCCGCVCSDMSGVWFLAWMVSGPSLTKEQRQARDPGACEAARQEVARRLGSGTFTDGAVNRLACR
jgi:hypothetical protein